MVKDLSHRIEGQTSDRQAVGRQHALKLVLREAQCNGTASFVAESRGGFLGFINEQSGD